jgi:hypothetical protein
MKFDKLVNEILNEGFKKNIRSKTDIENSHGLPIDSVGTPEKEIIKGLKMIKQSVKTSGYNGNHKAGGKIVDKALYNQALKFFKQLGSTGAVLNDLDDEESTLCEVIFKNISNDKFGYDVFNHISNAVEQGARELLRKDPTLGGTVVTSDPDMDEAGNLY